MNATISKKNSPAYKDRIPTLIMTIMASVALIIICFIFVFILLKAWPTLKVSGIQILLKSGFDLQVSDAFYATEDMAPISFGMLGLIYGTLASTGLALLLATVVAVGASVAIVEWTQGWLKTACIQLVRLLAAMPSVIFGLVGLMVVVPWLEKNLITVDTQIAFLEYFQMTGRNLLASTLVLGFMIVPTIVSLSVDALQAVPRAYREAGFSFGMSHGRVIYKILIPTAKRGIMSGILLGAGRGLGEAIAVSMVCGGIGIMPSAKLGLYNLLAPVLPLSAAIVNKSEAMGAGQVESALFTAAFLLLVFGVVTSLAARWIDQRGSVGAKRV